MFTKVKTIVISVDALVFEDLEYAKTLPNFSKLIQNGSVIERVRSIYPNLTHPVHASIMTGAPAGVTGVTSNRIFYKENPTRSVEWYNSLCDVKCDTLFHAAKRRGLTTAASCWPLTSLGGDVIDYLVPCVLNYRFSSSDKEPLEVYRECGATEPIIEILKKAIERFGYRDEHPAIEELQAFCSVEIIKKYKPDLLFTHPSYVDNCRHKTGPFTDIVKNAIKETDRWIGMILDAVYDAGIQDSTNVIILSDHGQLSTVRSVSPNVYLMDHGFIKLDEKGELISYEAFVKSASSCAYVYIRDGVGEKRREELFTLLKSMANEGIYGFSEVLTKQYVNEKYGLSGDFEFVLETDGYTTFEEYFTRPAVRNIELSDYRFGRGTHGYRPEKGPQPTFIACGPSFKSGVVLKNGNILNHAPTIAKVLGLELYDAEGTAVLEVIK
jgi:predicted AlkP superfamily pyrophosphatase or phosphodiesterase